MKKAIFLLILVFFSPSLVLGALVDNGDRTVTDTSTGLMWQKEGPVSTMNWEDALAYCENLLLAGYSDWRLPTIKELASIVNLDRCDPAIDTEYFPNTVSSYYWSSTTLAYYTSTAWRVHFYFGYVNGGLKSYSYYVRAVRGGQAGLLDNLVILKLLVYDSSTGEPVEGADVTLGSIVKETDSDGQTTFSDLSLGAYGVQISAAGYITYQTTINLNNAGTASMRYGLVPETPGSTPVVSDVTSYYSNRKKPALFLHGVDHDVTFSAAVSWNEKIPDKIRFITQNNIYDETCDGTSASHTFNMGQDFGVGGRLRVIAISQDGTESAPFDANIE
ncbi:MAG: DUF1566 domain-containing protein, partial [Armatimonadetes bacterium]|nr:DUF1566 domain-containing protein [Armatimonadota bacterium]